MTRTAITVTTEIELDTVTAAKWFWGLSDEDQAQFLIEIEKISRETTGGRAGMQWCYMMGHLQTCECSNQQTRDMVEEWASYLREAA